MSPPSTLFLLSLLPVALTLVLQPASDPTAAYNYPTGFPASHHINGHLSNHTANKTHPHALPSFTAVPIDPSNRTLVDALNFGIYAGQKLAHRNCTNVAGHNHHAANQPAWINRHTHGIPHATATTKPAPSPTSGTFPFAAAPASEGVGSLSPSVHDASIQIHPQMDDPIVPQPPGMQDPAVARVYSLGMKIGEQRCNLSASAVDVSTHHPGTKGALLPGVAKVDSDFNSQIRPAEKRYINPTAAAEMDEGMNDVKPHHWWNFFGKREQKREDHSDAWVNGQEYCADIPNYDAHGVVHGTKKSCITPPGLHGKQKGSRTIPEDKVSKGSDTDVEKKGNHPQPSAATSMHPPRSLPWVYLLLLGISVFISCFHTSMAAEPALHPQLQATGLAKRRARVICLEYRQRIHGHIQGGERLIGGHCFASPAGQAKRSDTPATIDQQETNLLAEAEEHAVSTEAEVVDIDATLGSKPSTLSCPGGTSTPCSFSAAKGFRPPRLLVGTSFLLLTSLLLSTHLIPSATAPVFPASKRDPNLEPVENPTVKEQPASPPNSGKRSHSAPFPIPKPSRTLHLAALLLFTLLFSTARAAPVDQMRQSLAPVLTPTPTVLSPLTSTPTMFPLPSSPLSPQRSPSRPARASPNSSTTSRGCLPRNLSPSLRAASGTPPR